MFAYLYLGGAAATAASLLSSDQFRRFPISVSLPLLFLGAALWPLALLSPLVQWISLRKGWLGFRKVSCVACSNEGVAREYADVPATTEPPPGWSVTLVPVPGTPRSTVWLVCSSRCARALHEDPPRLEEEP